MDTTKALKLGPLWERREHGRQYITGCWGPFRILIVPNPHRIHDRSPHYELWIVPKEGDDAQDLDPRAIGEQ